MSDVIPRPDYPFQSKGSEMYMYLYHLYSNIERGAWPALAVAVVLWLAFMMQSRIKKVRFGHAHMYLTIWLFCCLPTPLFINHYWVDLTLKYS